jgi:hypothetical protein
MEGAEFTVFKLLPVFWGGSEPPQCWFRPLGAPKWRHATYSAGTTRRGFSAALKVYRRFDNRAS